MSPSGTSSINCHSFRLSFDDNYGKFSHLQRLPLNYYFSIALRSEMIICNSESSLYVCKNPSRRSQLWRENPRLTVIAHSLQQYTDLRDFLSFSLFLSLSLMTSEHLCVFFFCFDECCQFDLCIFTFNFFSKTSPPSVSVKIPEYRTVTDEVRE